jgi:hypothetical protein
LTICEPVIHDAKGSFFEGAVLHPDGRVVIPGKKSFGSLTEYEAHINENFYNNYPRSWASLRS